MNATENAQTASPAYGVIISNADLAADAREIKALRQFVSPDATRFSLYTLWLYTTDDGATYVATDGHTMAVRRSGSHRTMVLADIAKLPTFGVGDRMTYPETAVNPPRWDAALQAPQQGMLAARYSVNPHYLARVGAVEVAAGRRAAEDFKPPPKMRPKDVREARSEKARRAFAVWTIGADPAAPWYWRMDTSAALWEGVVATRRV